MRKNAKTKIVYNSYYATLAFVCGYIGVFLSPMHLCFSTTREYFKADLKETYRRLLPPVLLTLGFTLAYILLMA